MAKYKIHIYSHIVNFYPNRFLIDLVYNAERKIIAIVRFICISIIERYLIIIFCQPFSLFKYFVYVLRKLNHTSMLSIEYKTK